MDLVFFNKGTAGYAAYPTGLDMDAVRNHFAQMGEKMDKYPTVDDRGRRPFHFKVTIVASDGEEGCKSRHRIEQTGTFKAYDAVHAKQQLGDIAAHTFATLATADSFNPSSDVCSEHDVSSVTNAILTTAMASRGEPQPEDKPFVLRKRAPGERMGGFGEY